jgi:chaperonin cofactor prefoldin
MIEDKDLYIKELKEKIKELEEKVIVETMVKKSEVMLNKELNERMEKYQLHIETLREINEKYSDLIAKLRTTLKKIVSQ